MGETVKQDIGSKLLFENDQVRVWDLQIAPGEHFGVHRHTNDYLLIYVGDASVRATNADGSTRFERQVHDGDVFFRDLGGGEDTHDAHNDGPTVARNFIIEMKKR